MYNVNTGYIIGVVKRAGEFSIYLCSGGVVRNHNASLKLSKT